MAGRNNRPNPRNVPTDDTIERERRVVELRRTGMTWDAIAVQVKFKSRGAAQTAYKRAFARVVSPEVELRRLEVADDLELLRRAALPGALRGDPKLITAMLQIEDRVVELFGLAHRHGVAERELAATERNADKWLAVLREFLELQGLANDAAALANMQAVLMRAHSAQVLELEGGDVVDAELVEDEPPAVRRPAPRKAPARKATKAAPARRAKSGGAA